MSHTDRDSVIPGEDDVVVSGALSSLASGNHDRQTLRSKEYQNKFTALLKANLGNQVHAQVRKNAQQPPPSL